MARKHKQSKKGNNAAALPVMRPDAAGIDIGAREIYVAVSADRATENVRCPGTRCTGHGRQGTRPGSE